MIYLLLGFIGLLAFDMLMEFREQRARWREVASGRAGLFALRMLTGIPDREELSRRFGAPDATFHYTVSPEQVQAARTKARQIFDKTSIELPLLGLAVMAGVYSAIEGSADTGLIIVCAAFLYRTIKRGHTVLVLLRCYRQMLEEGCVKFRLAKNQTG